MPSKKFQIFVSSTYEDLKNERAEVITAIHQIGHFASAMERFTASSRSQWDVIQDTIKSCDYFVVIVAGMYGSIGEGGQSYTEMEYRFAESQDIPVLGFVHKDVGKLNSEDCEKSEEAREKLETFKAHIKTRTCMFWEESTDLVSHVVRSIVEAVEREPRTGWIRADQATSEDLKNAYIAQAEELEELRSRRQAGSKLNTADLAQGEEEFSFEVSASGIWTSTYGSRTMVCKYRTSRTWRELQTILVRKAINGTSDLGASNAIAEDLFSKEEESIRSVLTAAWSESDQSSYGYPAKLHLGSGSLTINPADLRAICTQLFALGVWQPGKSAKTWELTDLGRSVGVHDAAIKRKGGI